MNIRDFVSLIPDDSSSESLMSIQSVQVRPAEKKAVVRCHLANAFDIEMQVASEFGVQLVAPGVQSLTTNPQGLVQALSRMIYAADEALAQGRATANKASGPNVILAGTPPSDMDLPTWNAKTQQWYDAEV